MAELLDHRGRPFKRRPLNEPQTAHLSALRHSIAGHPSRGLTPPKLARILAAAEQGDISAQCDLFLDMEEKDGHIFAEMAKRKRALLGLSWDIQPPLNATRAEARMAEEAAQRFAEIPDLEDIIFDMADAVGHGFACLEITWQHVGRHWGIAECRHQPQRWFNVRGNDIRLQNQHPEGEALWAFGWVVHQHRARSGHLPRAGLHRSLAWPYLFKNFSVRDLSEFLEIYGLPLRLGTYPGGTDEESKEILMRAVSQIGHDAAAIVPQGMMIDFKAAAKGGKDPFEYMVDWCERTQSKVILGATLTAQTDAGSGAYALGNVHMEVMRDLVISDARQIQNTITRDLVYPLCALNMQGITPGRSPRFVFDTHECEDIKVFADALPKLVDIGMQIGADYAHEKLGIPRPQEGDRVLQRQAAADQSGLKSGLGVCKDHHHAPDAVDQYVQQLDDASMAAMADLIAPVQALVMQAESLQALRDGIIDLYADMDTTALGVVMEQALLAAELAGRFEAQDD